MVNEGKRILMTEGPGVYIYDDTDFYVLTWSTNDIFLSACNCAVDWMEQPFSFSTFCLSKRQQDNTAC
jgi:hypothetical protein